MDHKTDLQQGLRIGILDIETSGLNADFGYIFCACIKEVGGPVFTIRIDDPRNKDKFSDRFVVRELIKLMNEFDLVVTWYGSRFDIPFINTRALKHRLRPPNRNYRRDLCFVARGVGKLRNNQLVTWDEYLHGRALKTRLTPDIWNSAIRGDKKALDYITEHCVRDVVSTEKVYRRLMPLFGKLRRG